MDAHMVRYMVKEGYNNGPVRHTKFFKDSRKFYKWVIKYRHISDFGIVSFMNSLHTVTDVEILEMWSMYKIEQEEV